MVAVSQPSLEHYPLIKTCKPSSSSTTVSSVLNAGGIPVVDMRDPEAKTLIVKAFEEYGLFKLVNHGVPLDFMTRLEAEALTFFNLPHSDKHKAAAAAAAAAAPPPPPHLLHPFVYGSNTIGRNGDTGWIEYLLLNPNTSLNTLSIQTNFRSAVSAYIEAAKRVAIEVLEVVADGLKIEARDVLSRLLKDEKSDSCFRINHYPPLCPELQPQLEALNNYNGRSLIGFGEHTDPQIISVLRSNNTSGLQICLKDGSTWVSVPPDPTSFFINVGDALQVLTNGRFRSVRHRVLADSLKSRVSMIYFGGPALSEKIAPLPSLLANGEESLYKEFTWWEYKTSAYMSRLGDNRLRMFEKTSGQ